MMIKPKCKTCIYYHKENNICQAKKCATHGDGYVTLFDRLFCTHKPMTHADKLRAMSDEGLARFIACQRGWYCDFKDPMDDDYPMVLEWLKEECER